MTLKSPRPAGPVSSPATNTPDRSDRVDRFDAGVALYAAGDFSKFVTSRTKRWIQKVAVHSREGFKTHPPVLRLRSTCTHDDDEGRVWRQICS